MRVLKNSMIGLCAGFITGFFSTGGGMLVLPALIYLEKMDEKKARGTTVFSILPMVVVASFFYYKVRRFDILLGVKCAIGGVVGGILGTKLLKKIPNKYLKIIFIIFLIYAAYNMLR